MVQIRCALPSIFRSGVVAAVSLYGRFPQMPPTPAAKPVWCNIQANNLDGSNIGLVLR